MSAIQQQENDLFNDWGYTKYRDGIVCEKTWNQTTPKIMFILKETNDLDGDLRNFLQGGGDGKTWNNVARWSAGIKHLDESISYDRVRHYNKERRARDLSRICAVNLKKTTGGSVTDNNALQDFCINNKEQILKQLHLYYKDVDIIICCGQTVAEIFLPLVGLKYNANNRLQTDKNGKIVISYMHPCIRNTKNTSNEKAFMDLMNLVKNASENK